VLEAPVRLRPRLRREASAAQASTILVQGRGPNQYNRAEISPSPHERAPLLTGLVLLRIKIRLLFQNKVDANKQFPGYSYQRFAMSFAS